jgi:hypothetical protein
VVRGGVHLDRAGQHWIGRRQYCPEQDGGGQIQTQQQSSCERHSGDSRQHDRSAQPPGGHPGRISEWQAELQSADEEGDDHRDLGQPLEPADLLPEIDAEPVEPQRPDGQPECQVDRRGGDREVAEPGRRERHEEQQPAGKGHPAEEVHAKE